MTSITSITGHVAGGSWGTSLIPSVRPLWAGGLSDLLAQRRHERRRRARARNADS